MRQIFLVGRCTYNLETLFVIFTIKYDQQERETTLKDFAFILFSLMIIPVSIGCTPKGKSRISSHALSNFKGWLKINLIEKLKNSSVMGVENLT